MPFTVTVPGVQKTSPTYSTIALQYQTQQNATLAIQLLSQIYAAAGQPFANTTGESLLVQNDSEAPTAGTNPTTLKEFTIGDSGGIQNTGTTEGTVPAGYLGIVDAYTNQVAEIVGAPGQTNETVVAGGNMHFYTNGGSGTIISGQGNNLINALPTGDGNWTVFFDGGNNTVYANSGNFFIEDGNASTTGANMIFLGSGSDTVASWGNDTIVAGPNNTAFVATFTPGSIFYANTGKSTFVDRGGADTFVAGGGSDTVFAAASGGSYFGSSGPLLFVAGPNTADSVVAGSGPTTIYSASGANLTFGGSGNGDLLIAGPGSATVNGGSSTGNDLYFADGNGSDSIVAGSGNNTLVAGMGSDTFTGGPGANLFVIDKAAVSGGTYFINNWNSKDTLALFGYGAPTAAGGLPAGATVGVQGGSEVLTLPDGTKITFVGVSSVPNSQIPSA